METTAPEPTTTQPTTTHHTLRDVVRRDPVTLDAQESIRRAAAVLRTGNVSSLLVRADGGPWSVVTERDVTSAVADGADLDAPVAGISTPTLLTVDADGDLRDAAVLMLHYGVRHLVVLDGRTAIGVVSMRDVLNEMVAHGSADPFVVRLHQALTTRSDCWLG